MPKQLESASSAPSLSALLAQRRTPEMMKDPSNWVTTVSYLGMQSDYEGPWAWNDAKGEHEFEIFAPVHYSDLQVEIHDDHDDVAKGIIQHLRANDKNALVK
ncbi:MAG: hypothetical protein WCO78_02425 [Candidatus Roizmanbacteria bacterium]